MHEPHSLADLFPRAREGDQTAWNEIVDRHTNLLWSVGRAFRLSTADSADVVQITWLRLVENLSTIRDPERLPGWLVTTARRECLRVLRRSGREIVAWTDDGWNDLADGGAAIDTGLLEAERDSELWRFFSQLSDRCQELLRVLIAAEPPAYAAVSQALGLPIGSIGPTRMRCLERLRLLTLGTSFAPRGQGGGIHHE